MMNRSQRVSATLGVAVAAMVAFGGTAHAARTLDPVPPTTPPPAPVVPGCETCPSACLVSTYSGTYYEYGVLPNAQKGDALLYKGVGIASMLGLNFLFSHVGLMTNNNEVQHNSASILALTNSYHVLVGVGSWQQVGNLIAALFSGFYGAARLDANALYAMTPGIRQDRADGGSQFGSLEGTWRNDLTLLQPISPRRADAEAATNWMSSHQGYPYRIFGFMDYASSEASGGGVCSGTIATANNQSPRTASAAMAPHSLSSVDTGMAVLNLQATLWHMIRWDVVSPLAPNILGSGARDDVASGLTDQVINCALYLQPGGCNLMNSAYMSRALRNIGQGSGTALPVAQAISPDHLAFTGPQNGEWSAPGRTADARWINKIDAGAWQGGVLVDPQFSGGQWVTWTSNYGHCDPNGVGGVGGTLPYQP